MSLQIIPFSDRSWVPSWFFIQVPELVDNSVAKAMEKMPSRPSKTQSKARLTIFLLGLLSGYSFASFVAIISRQSSLLQDFPTVFITPISLNTTKI